MVLIAIAAVLACLAAKLLLALKAKALQKNLSGEKLTLQAARKEMHQAEGKGKILKAERSQLEQRRKRINAQISRSNKALGGYAEQEKKEKERSDSQQNLMRETKK